MPCGIPITSSVTNSGWLQNGSKPTSLVACIKKKVVVENCRPIACRGKLDNQGGSCQGAEGSKRPNATRNEQLPGLCIFARPLWFCQNGTIRRHSKMPCFSHSRQVMSLCKCKGILTCCAMYPDRSCWKICSQSFSVFCEIEVGDHLQAMLSSLLYLLMWKVMFRRTY